MKTRPGKQSIPGSQRGTNVWEADLETRHGGLEGCPKDRAKSYRDSGGQSRGQAEGQSAVRDSLDAEQMGDEAGESPRRTGWRVTKQASPLKRPGWKMMLLVGLKTWRWGRRLQLGQRKERRLQLSRRRDWKWLHLSRCGTGRRRDWSKIAAQSDRKIEALPKGNMEAAAQLEGDMGAVAWPERDVGGATQSKGKRAAAQLEKNETVAQLDRDVAAAAQLERGMKAASEQRQAEDTDSTA